MMIKPGHLPAVSLALALLTACQQHPSPGKPAVQRIALPAALAPSLWSSGELKMYALLDGENPRLMAIDTGRNQASLSMVVAPGQSHTVTIEARYLPAGQDDYAVIARVVSDVFQMGTQPKTISITGNYAYDFDQDQDGVSNIDEVKTQGYHVFEADPVFSAESLSFATEENAATTFELAAASPNTVSFSLQAGDDGELFEIVDGKLGFKSPPDFEKPHNGGATANSYTVMVTAADGLASNTRAVTVTVTDVFDMQLLGQTKRLRFLWQPAAGAASYRLLQTLSGTEGFAGIGAVINAETFSLAVAGHLYPWTTAQYLLEIHDTTDALIGSAMPISPGRSAMLAGIGRLVGFNTEAEDGYGDALAMSGDGGTLAIGAPLEDGSATGAIAAAQAGGADDNDAADAGAVYIFGKDSAGDWNAQAYIKAPNTDSLDRFGASVSLSADGNTLAVGAPGEQSQSATDRGDNVGSGVGAVYIYTRVDGVWIDTVAYIKPTNLVDGHAFGTRLALDDGGDDLVILANGSGFPNSVYTAAGKAGWKAVDLGVPLNVIRNVAISGDGNTVVAGGYNQSQKFYTDLIALFDRNMNMKWGAATTINRNRADTTTDAFGASLSLNSDGTLLAVGAPEEDGNATEVGGDTADNQAEDAGAVFVYSRAARNTAWSDTPVYIKPSNNAAGNRFGQSVRLAGVTVHVEGKPAPEDLLIVGAPGEDGGGTGVYTIPPEAAAASPDSGAVYAFRLAGGVPAPAWTQTAYIKAAEAGQSFGARCALSPGLDVLPEGGAGPVSGLLVGGGQTVYLY